MTEQTERVDILNLKERIATAGLSGAGVDLTLAERNFLLDAINEVSKPEPTKPRLTAYLDPGYTLKRIDWIWAFLSTDENGEGVCAAPIGALGAVPLIAADNDRMRSLRPYATHVAKVFGKEVILAKFTTREDVEIIKP